MKRVLSFVLSAAAAAVLLFPIMAQAASLEPFDSSAVQVQQQEQNGVRYLAGGIGDMSRKTFSNPRATTCT